MLKRFFNHWRNYSLGSLLTVIGGFVTFPLLTRNLSVDDYGMLSLLGTTLAFLVAVGKLGVQHAGLLVYSDINEGKTKFELRNFMSTFILGMGIQGILILTLWLIFTYYFSGIVFGEGLEYVLFLCAPIILGRVIKSSVSNVVRAREQSALEALFGTLNRWVTLAFIVGLILLWEPTLRAYFYAVLLAEWILLIALVFLSIDWKSVKLKYFSGPMWAYLIKLGVPMLIYELSGIFVHMGDRYLINILLGKSDLGQYAAAYNLCDMVAVIIVSTIKAAFLPMCLNLWAKGDEKAVRELFDRTVRVVVTIILPVGVGFSIVGGSIIVILASDKYEIGAKLIPYIIMGKLLDAAMFVLAIGLFIHKKTNHIMIIRFSGAIINLLLNLVLIPHLGLLGAAYATLFTYLYSVVFARIVSNRFLSIKLPWDAVFRVLLATVLMGGIVLSVGGQGYSQIAAQISVGVVSYVVLILIIDRKLLDLVKQRFLGAK